MKSRTCGLFLDLGSGGKAVFLQEGLLDTGAVEAQTAGEGKGDLIARESSPFAGSYPVMSFLGFNNIVHPKGNQS